MNQNIRIAKALVRLARQLVATIVDRPEAEPDPSEMYVWAKGNVDVYACPVTNDNVDICTALYQANCKEELNKEETKRSSATVGKYIFYNPDLSFSEGCIWQNKIGNYKVDEGKDEKALGDIWRDDLQVLKKDKSMINGIKRLVFTPYHFTKAGLTSPENAIEKGKDGEYFVGFRVPSGMKFTIPQGCGNNGSDGSGCDGNDDYWLAISDTGQFDWGRTVTSMRQSNYECLGKAPSRYKLNSKCQKAWDDAYEKFKNGK